MLLYATVVVLLLISKSNAEVNINQCNLRIQTTSGSNKTVACRDDVITIANRSILFKNPVNTALSKYDLFVTNTFVKTIASEDTPINSLQKLYLAHNTITKLTQKTFQNLPNLELIDLSWNQLVDDDISAFINLNFLKLLNLSHNHLGYIATNFKSLPALEILDLSCNSIQSIDSPVLVQNVNIRTIFLQHNKLSKLHLQAASLQYIDASFNTLTIINTPDLVRLNVQHNNVTAEINFSDTEVDISYNSITGFRAISENTRSISANNNKIQILRTSFFPNSKHLEYLDLSYNIITDIQNQALATLTQIKKMNFSHNEMQDFNFRVFDDLNSLELLDISHNKFIYLYNIPFAGPFSFDNLGRLNTIILNNNQWSCDILKQLSKSTLLVIGAHTTCKSDVNDFVIDFDKTVPIETDVQPSSAVEESEVERILQKFIQNGTFNQYIKNLTGFNKEVVNKFYEIELTNTTIFDLVKNLTLTSQVISESSVGLKQVHAMDKSDGKSQVTSLFCYVLIINTITTGLLLLVIIVTLIIYKRREYKKHSLNECY